jgi:hypothetical protein
MGHLHHQISRLPPWQCLYLTVVWRTVRAKFSMYLQQPLICLSVDTPYIPSNADESTMPMIRRRSVSLSTSQSSISEKSESERLQKSMRLSFTCPSGLTLVCIGVHVVVVLLHVFFLISWRFGWEQKITFEIGRSSDTASTIVTVALQSLATVSRAG